MRLRHEAEGLLFQHRHSRQRRTGIGARSQGVVSKMVGAVAIMPNGTTGCV